MTKFILILCSIISALFLNGCSQILETIILSDEIQGITSVSDQEEFDINVKTLTFKNAQIANNNPYPRQLMLTGIGTEANVFNESDFLNSKIPPSIPKENYLLNIGDELSFQRLDEVADFKTNFPKQTNENEYLLGVGDELTLIQLNYDVNRSVFINEANSIGQNKKNSIPEQNESVLTISNIVGSNGNILLLGLGSIAAENRSLDYIQTEVRNILIRDGLAPNFQLEITGFNSKKAFVKFQGAFESNTDNVDNVIPITNLQITLKELILTYGLQPSERESLNIKLVRDKQIFRMTAKQIFENSSGEVVILDKDQIEISKTDLSISDSVKTIVGSNGNILLPNIGSLKAEARSLTELQADIRRILIKQGISPSFQLEITNFTSRRFFLITEGKSSLVVPIADKALTLKEAVLSSNHGTQNELTIIKLVRDGKNYQMTFQEMVNGLGSKVQVQDGDTIELRFFKYKPGQVFALAGAGNAKLLPIDPSKRETLADILFTTNGVLNNPLAKRSEVYLLRGQNPSIAYHLDAQNVSRILVAANMELRPNDIIYVADRPIVSFTRTLAEIFPLRALLRDIQNNEIP